MTTAPNAANSFGKLLEAAGIRPTQGVQDAPYWWEHPAPTDPGIPPRPVLLLVPKTLRTGKRTWCCDDG
ncbi:MAG: hypothetical protein JO287_16570 [Pseudonocardiales bacterium]|nr:hypothetical protein [Pseudonocardiales bacterium]